MSRFLKNNVNKEIEEKRNLGEVGSSLEAKVSLHCNDKSFMQLNDFKDQRNNVSLKIEKITDSITSYDLNILDIESNSTVTKLTVTSEDFDTDSAFADSKFTVPSGKAGKYFFVGKARMVNTTGYIMLEFYKNGSNAGIQFRSQSYSTTYESAIVTAILDLSASDYVELYGMQVSGSANDVTSKLFQGFKLG